MSTVLELPRVEADIADGLVVLEGVSFKTYRQLEKDLGDRRVPHLVFWEGSLEIMSPSSRHEFLGLFFYELVQICGRLTKQRIRGAGSTTLQRTGVRGGAQPDQSFYIKNAARVVKKMDLDFAEDPPPDLVVEIDLTSASTKKVKTDGLYARLGVPEIWRCDVRSRFRWNFGMLALSGNEYVQTENSLSFPQLTAGLIRQALAKLEAEGQWAALDWFEEEFKKTLGNKPKTKRG